MKLHEYQSKYIFSKYGIPIPKGRVAATAEAAKLIAQELGGRVVIKAQVLVGGRGKAGGVKVAKDPAEAEQIATQILSMEIKGMPVHKVLVDEAASIQTEIYFAITNDRSARRPVMIASSAGGVEIEEVARTDPDKIIREYVDPMLGLRDYQIRNIANPSIDLDNVPGPTVASRAFLVRSTVLVLSEHPVDGGSMFLAFSLTKIQAAAVVLLPMRFTTDGLRGVQAHVDSSGVITSAGLYSFDPDAAAPAEFSSLSALSASSAIVGFNPLAQAYNGSTYFPLTMPRGANIYASLPITQTPTLFVRIRGFVS